MVETRKVQKVGYSTLSVSLPMSWAKKIGVKKGDLVFISEESDGALRLATKQGRSENNVEYIVDVDRCDNTTALARVIVGNYVLGRNILRVESSRRLMREQIEVIREVTQGLLGIGIIEESDRHLLLQCSIDPNTFPLETVVRRLYVITSIMFKEVLDSLIDGDLELAKDAITREYEADTIYWLLARLLASAQQSRLVSEGIGITDPIDIVQYNIIAWYLEMIGDRVNDIAQKIIDFQPIRKDQDLGLIERLTQIGMMTLTMFDKAVKSIFEGDMSVASDSADLYENIDHEENNLMKRFQNGSSPELTAAVSEIAWDFKIIAEHSAAIAEIVIDNILKGQNDYCYVNEDREDE
ncbi:MAG: PhoU domain-containing protein [Candidatus Bathyarchaeota archaeon]|jgi:phosphate uptake regulator